MMTQPIASMTGFARNDGALDAWRWTWELKSVNGRAHEIRFRLPSSFDDLEPGLRKSAQEKIKRGSVFATLKIAKEETHARMHVNEAALAEAIAYVEKVRERVPDCAPPRAESILALRGVMEAAEEAADDEARTALTAAILKGFKEAIGLLAASRRREGEAMAEVLEAAFAEIDRLTEAARSLEETTPEKLQTRIAAQLKELLPNGTIPEDRLAQEAALLAVKIDVREELDRLRSHITAGRALLKRGGVVGRELDFLTQEFNREANTLCSKAHDMTLKRIGLDLKKTIDQLREQVQNIE